MFQHTFPLNSTIKVVLKGSDMSGSQSREPGAERWILNHVMSVGSVFRSMKNALMEELKVSVRLAST